MNGDIVRALEPLVDAFEGGLSPHEVTRPCARRVELISTHHQRLESMRFRVSDGDKGPRYNDASTTNRTALRG